MDSVGRERGREQSGREEEEKADWQRRERAEGSKEKGVMRFRSTMEHGLEELTYCACIGSITSRNEADCLTHELS